MKKILDVGQCNLDHGNITQTMARHFNVDVQRAHSHDEAVQMAKATEFDLILINRLLDADGTEGQKVLSSLKADSATSQIPVMIVSNHAEAQEKAIAAGAVRGFGKSALTSPETVTLLQEYL